MTKSSICHSDECQNDIFLNPPLNKIYYIANTPRIVSLLAPVTDIILPGNPAKVRYAK